MLLSPHKDHCRGRCASIKPFDAHSSVIDRLSPVSNMGSVGASGGVCNSAIVQCFVEEEGRRKKGSGVRCVGRCGGGDDRAKKRAGGHSWHSELRDTSRLQGSLNLPADTGSAHSHCRTSKLCVATGCSDRLQIG